jgi:DNA polymerase-3 subunit alpha
MKIHHPVAFYKAQLSKIKEDKWPKLIRDAQDHGIAISGVDINYSGETWTPDVPGRRVTAGFLQLKGVGPGLCKKILDYRTEYGEFEKSRDLLKVNGIGPKVFENILPMIEGDDPFGLMRTQIELDSVRAAIADRSIPLRNPNVNSEGILDLPGGREVFWVGKVKLKEYKDYIEDERARSGKSLEEIRAEMKSPELSANCVLHAYDDAGEDVYVRISRYKFPQFKSGLEKLREDEDVIWVYAKKSRGGFGASIYAERMIVIDPSDDDEDNEDDS